MNERLVEVYRHKAAECERMAALAAEERLKRTFSEVARQWHDMAEHAESLDRMRRQ